MDAIQQHASQRGDAAALIQDDRTVTWRELDARGNQVARALRRRGVGEGDRVAVGLRNSIEFFELVVGAGRIGATLMPVSFRFMRDEVEYMVDDAKATLVIAEPANRDVFAGIPDTIFRGAEYDEWVGAESADPLDDQVGTGLAMLRYYTSGTTGRPKAVIRLEDPERAAVMMESGQAVFQARLGVVMQPGEVHLLAAVVYHTAPGAYSTMALTSGHTVVIMDHFDAEEALRLIERHRVSWTQMAPIHLVRIVALPDDVQHRYDLSSMKRLLHAGAPCPVDVKWKTLELFPEGTVYEYYAATEGYATECPAEDWLRKPGTVGRPARGIEIHILDDDGNEVGPGEIGQVYIDNGSKFEYEGAPEKTRDTWRGNAFSVGDMGYVDDDGFLFLTDRKSHMIISGGANIYPAEVENVLFGHPAVADVAVIGVPDDEFGEQVKAVVQARSEVTEAELLGYCRERLAHYKCPKSVDFVDELPRDPNGKIRKAKLRDPYWEGRTTRI
ncbi:MAG TPA: AMP-binding protein [Acidimicrobiia bacterium]|nr:AMP-binding protein [Acidimicrobiia bacterium]